MELEKKKGQLEVSKAVLSRAKCWSTFTQQPLHPRAPGGTSEPLVSRDIMPCHGLSATTTTSPWGK